MKRVLLAACLVLALCGVMFTVGCGGSDDNGSNNTNNGNSIVGSWMHDTEGWTVTISANGTWSDSSGATGSWSTSGSTLTITENDGTSNSTNFLVVGNKLTLSSAQIGVAVFTRQ